MHDIIPVMPHPPQKENYLRPVTLRDAAKELQYPLLAIILESLLRRQSPKLPRFIPESTSQSTPD
jgi:hypothetical protein